MALRKTAGWGPLVLACAFGCATSVQDNGVAPPPGGDQGGSDTAGTGGTDTTTAGTTTEPTAGTFATGGTNATGGTAPAGGTFTSGGTFTTAGFTTGGTFGTGGTGTGGGGAATGGSGGAAAGAGGKASGGTGGGSAGAGGKGGSASTGGTGGGGTCKSTKLTPVSATDAGMAEYAPSQAIDGDPTTRWSSQHMIATGYLQLDMGASVMINHVNMAWETSYATDYKLQVADDAAGPYTDLYENKAGPGGTEDILSPPIVPHAGRYFRMQGVTLKNMYGYSIWEIVIYGDPDPSCK